MESSASPYTTRKRQRASIACQNCNLKRTRCNAATAGLPCSNCQRTGLDCRLLNSRRGKQKANRENVVEDQADDERGATRVDGAQITGGLRYQPQESLPGYVGENAIPSCINTTKHHGLQAGQNVTNDESVSSLQINPAGNASDTPSKDGPIKGSHNSAFEAQQRPDIVFAQTTEDDTPRQHSTNPDDHVVYPTENFNLAYVVRQIQPQSEAISEDRSTNPKQLPHENHDVLRSQNSFDIPKCNICLSLFKTFFEYVAPHYPIIDRRSFIVEYAIPRRPPSWLLLQAVIFMAAGHCDEALLKDAGFESRHHARMIFFKRAKALYDADYERDKVTIIQAVFLMSFWWADPSDPKDTWHWLGIAINLALSIGMHRSTKGLGMSLRQRRLWRRIWWSLFAEDKHAAAALGRPVHIRLSDCNVEPLQISDFCREPFGFGENFSEDLPKVVVAYPIFLSSLSKILERFVEKPPPTFPSYNTWLELCEGMLQVWEGGLSEYLHLDHPESDNTIWPGMLHIAMW